MNPTAPTGDLLRWCLGEVTVTRVPDGVIPIRPEHLLPDLDEAHTDGLPWAATYVDAKGRVRLSLHTFVVSTPTHTVVVDTCVGAEFERPLPGDPRFLDRLDGAVDGGLAAVDTVVATHCHFDHVGWHVHTVEGERRPVFPSARYVFTAAEVDALALDDHHGLGGAVIEPLRAAGRLDLVEPGHRIGEELELVATPGHTPGHVSLRITSGGRTALITGDAVHTPIQFVHPDVSATPFDADSDQARATRRRLVAELADTDTLVLGTHFPPPSAGLVRTTAAGGVDFDDTVGDVDPDRRELLVLCTGNYYRSRTAEELFNHLAVERGLRWRATSRALRHDLSDSPNEGPMSSFAVEYLAGLGVSPRAADRMPRPATNADLDRADLVVAVHRSEHEPMVRDRFPDRVVRYWDIGDHGEEPARQALPRLVEAVRSLVDELAEEASA